ncbi:DMT family transporter [Larkinella terrae]|uniref:EamA family transporter n=1 Tax=Larkinella terrae TaxID=2025311 RepID=A0A7K0EH12_9BACT|nr:DMT family transporter [Larkinella terrae]MRS60746.1 EamA family transporter [Larkinella terrae]
MSSRLSLFIGVLCISIFPVLVKSTPISGISDAFYRMSIATVLIWPYVVIRKKWQPETLRYWKPIVLCGVFFASDIAVWNLSIHYSTATQASLLTNLSPIWVGIATFLFFPEKPNRYFWLGTALAVIGLVLLMGIEMFIQMKFDSGFFFAVLSGLFYAAYIVVSKTVLKKVPILNFMACSMTVSSLFLVVLCLVLGEPLWGFEPRIWGSLIIQALICQLLGWFSVSHALQKIDAQRVSLSLLSQAVVTGLIAWAFIDEKITPQMILGGIIILLGIAITFKRTRTHGPAGRPV